MNNSIHCPYTSFHRLSTFTTYLASTSQTDLVYCQSYPHIMVQGFVLAN